MVERLRLLIVLLVCALPTHALEAQPAITEAEARVAFARGVELFDAGDFEGAASAFERASRGLSGAVVRLNYAVALEKSGRRVRALAVYERLVADPGNLNPERLERARAALVALDAALGRVTIQCSQTGVALSGPDGEIGLTPLASPLRVEPGTAFIHASLKGFEPQIIPVVARAGQTTDVTVEMVATEAKLGEIALTSRLRGATVLLEGREVGVTPLGSTLAVRAGQPHRLEVRRKGYLTGSAQVTVDEGATVRVELTPAIDDIALRDSGAEVRLAIGQEGASVRVDGERVADPRVLKLPPGVHEIVVTRENYESSLRVVDLEEATPTTLTINLAPTPAYRVQLRDEARANQNAAIALLVAGSLVTAGSTGMLVWARVDAPAVEADLAAIDNKTAPYEHCTIPENEEKCKKIHVAILGDDDRVLGLTIGGAIGIPLGVAGVVTGVVMFATGEDPTQYDLPPLEDLGSARLTPLFDGGPGGFRIGVGGSF